MIYSSPIPRISLPEFLLIVFVLLTLIFDFKKYRYESSILPFLLVLILNIAVVVWTKNSDTLTDDLGTSLRLIFYYLIMFFFLRDYFDYKFSFKLLIFISIFLSLYGLLQFAFSFKKIFLYNFIPFLPQISGGSTYQSIIIDNGWGLQYRMPSLFREPAHFATYLLVPMCLLLFKEKKNVMNISLGLFFAAVSFATLSSLGIIATAGIVVSFIVILFIKKELLLWQRIAFVVALGIGLVVFFVAGGWDFFVSKTFGEDEKFINILTDSRLNVLPLMRKSSVTEFFFGRGMAYIGIYMSSYVLSVYSLGFLGLIGLSAHMAMIFNKIKLTSSIVLLIVYLVINVGSEVAFGSLCLPFIAFLICDQNDPVSFFKRITL